MTQRIRQVEFQLPNGHAAISVQMQCPSIIHLLLLLLLWHAPLAVRSAKRIHQSPEWTILIHDDRFAQGEVCLYFRSCWIVFIHVVPGRPGGLLQFSKGTAVKIFLASVSSDIRAMWPHRKKRHVWTMTERCGCPVV